MDYQKTKAINLLRENRFDINAKTIYGRHREKNVQSNFYKALYLSHIKAWNNFYERDPRKNSPQDFINAFDSVLDSVKNEGFLNHEKNYVPTKNGYVYNGAHRVASSIVYDKDVVHKEDDREGQLDCSYKFFKQIGLHDIFLDEMALEFVRNKDNVYTINLFAPTEAGTAEVNKIISKYSDIVLEKNINLTTIGKVNYIVNLYEGERWIGNYQNGFVGAKSKADACFGQSKNLVFYLVTTSDPDSLLKCKEELRKYFNRDKHSVHINDTQEETWRAASTMLNKNSLFFLNTCCYPRMDKFNFLFEEYLKFLSDKNKEDFCISSSAVMSLFNLRDCNDIDYLCHDEEYADLKNEHYASHEDQLKYYSLSKDDIIFNPMNHLYFKGVKFSTIKVVQEMKKNRKEQKDYNDLRIMG